jgi:hypothetical protein
MELYDFVHNEDPDKDNEAVQPFSAFTGGDKAANYF